MVALGRWVGAYRTPPDQGGIGIGPIVPRERLHMLVRYFPIREVALHVDLIPSLFSVSVCVQLPVLPPSRYEFTHTQTRLSRNKVVKKQGCEIIHNRRTSNEVSNDEEERQKKGEYRSTNHKAYQSVPKRFSLKRLRKAQKSFTLLSEKLYFTLRKALLYF